MPQLNAQVETWPIAGTFRIARGSKTQAHVVVATLSDGRCIGRGECVPYARYGETIDSVLAEIGTLGEITDRQMLRQAAKAGAARNAVDCALWDLEAKTSGHAASRTAGITTLEPVLTCYTLSLASAAEMASKAEQVPQLPLLKLKLGGGMQDVERMRAVRAARPDARLVADANEGWSAADLPMLMAAAAEARLELIEQPLPEGEDDALRAMPHLVAVCADESAHTTADLKLLAGRYDAVNIKLDKAGGLTEALDMRKTARDLGLKVMVGCMVATSLAMAPALLVAQDADWVDLDGPLLLERDRVPGLIIRNGIVQPAPSALWG